MFTGLGTWKAGAGTTTTSDGKGYSLWGYGFNSVARVLAEQLTKPLLAPPLISEPTTASSSVRKYDQGRRSQFNSITNYLRCGLSIHSRDTLQAKIHHGHSRVVVCTSNCCPWPSPIRVDVSMVGKSPFSPRTPSLENRRCPGLFQCISPFRFL